MIRAHLPNMLMQGPPGPNYQELYNDIEEQFKEYKREAQKTQQMLVEDVSLGMIAMQLINLGVLSTMFLWLLSPTLQKSLKSFPLCLTLLFISLC